MFGPAFVLLDLVLVMALGALGMLGAWLLRRRSTLSVKNLYLAAVVMGLAFGVSVAARAWSAVLVLAPVCAAALTGAACGRRWRLADLGAGEELRQHELSRRWVWQPAPVRQAGERRYIASRGEMLSAAEFGHGGAALGGHRGVGYEKRRWAIHFRPPGCVACACGHRASSGGR